MQVTILRKGCNFEKRKSLKLSNCKERGIWVSMERMSDKAIAVPIYTKNNYQEKLPSKGQVAGEIIPTSIEDRENPGFGRVN